MRQTSINALNELKKSGALVGRRLQVYEVLAKLGPMTAGELKDRMTEVIDTRDIDTQSAHKRLTELRDSGLVYELGTRKCKATGKVVIEWDVTGATSPLTRPIKNFTYQRAKEDLQAIRQSGRQEVIDALSAIRGEFPYASWVLIDKTLKSFLKGL